MRLWSIHPRYLDAKGLTACWREALLARKVLLGQTKGYRNHPQLIRFKNTVDPIAAINQYLKAILCEAQHRGYNYDAAKIELHTPAALIQVTQGQVDYELSHLKKKLAIRDRQAYERLNQETEIAPHPLFCVVSGAVESWEIIDQ